MPPAAGAPAGDPRERPDRARDRSRGAGGRRPAPGRVTFRAQGGAMATDWKVSGTYFEACNCDVACPCVFTSAPTTGACTVLLAWHVDSGRFGDVTLDGLNAALAAESPGHMMQGGWKVALYVDERADQKQRDALAAVFSGQGGGHLAALGPLIAQVLGVKAVPIVYETNGKKRRLSIPGIAESEVAAIAGQGGADVTISHHPFTAVPGHAAVVSKSTKMTYKDHGRDWQISDKNGFYSPFAYASA
jgi:hypothetical protein